MDWRTMAVIVALTLAGTAGAQVHKCIDAAGKVAFSDVPCPTASKKAERVLSSDATDRRWENEAYGRERNMQSIENATRILRAPTSDGVGDAGGGIINNGPNDPGGTNRIRAAEDRQRAEIALAAARRRAAEEQARQAELERRRPAAPSIVSSCDRGGCWDTSGNRYNRAGDGQNFWRSDGRFCRADRDAIRCN